MASKVLAANDPGLGFFRVSGQFSHRLINGKVEISGNRKTNWIHYQRVLRAPDVKLSFAIQAIASH